MKKINLLWIAAAIFLLPCKYACSNKNDTLGKAKLVFEQEYEKTQNILDSVLRMGPYDSIRWITLNEQNTYWGHKLNNLKFTPLWDKAVLSSSSIIVPIIPERKFIAELYEKESDIGRKWWVPILQKLVVDTSIPVKCYVASYIPTPEYLNSLNLNNEEDFGDLEQLVDFDGIILYCDLQNGIARKVEKYIDGKLVQSLDNHGDDKAFGKEVPKTLGGELLNIGRSQTEEELQEFLNQMRGE